VKFVPPKVYTEAEINNRWEKKRSQIKHLSKNIRKFKIKVDKDLSSDDEKIKITSTIAKIMEITAERVGNDESSSNGHYGVSNFTKKHIKISGSNVTLKYIGKSGVDHNVTFSHAKVAKNLKDLLKKNPTDIFSTSEGQSIKNTQVNSYLAQFNITSKDLRGFKANKLMTSELRKYKKTKDIKEIKKNFNEALRKVAEIIQHTPSILRSAYLLPEIETTYYKYGSIGYIKNI